MRVTGPGPRRARHCTLNAGRGAGSQSGFGGKVGMGRGVCCAGLGGGGKSTGWAGAGRVCGLQEGPGHIRVSGLTSCSHSRALPQLRELELLDGDPSASAPGASAAAALRKFAGSLCSPSAGAPPLGARGAAPVPRGEERAERKGHGGSISLVSLGGFGFPCGAHSEGRVHTVIARKCWELRVLKMTQGHRELHGAVSPLPLGCICH